MKKLITGITEIKDYKIKEKEKGDIIFQVGSISKPITSICIMKLIENKILELNTNANKYLKTWKIKNKKGEEDRVTIKQLLGHTAGISCSGFIGYKQGKIIPQIDQILEGMSPCNSEKIYRKYKKGKYRYSGGGYQILQKIIEEKTGKGLEKLAEELIFKPLKMENTSFSIPKKIKKEDFIYPEKAAAGLWTTSNDIAKLIIEVQLSYKNKSNQILSKKSIKKILTPVTKAEGGHMGLGIFISKDRKKFYHSGHNVGYKSMFILDLEGNGIITLTNDEKEKKFSPKKICKKYIQKFIRHSN